MPGRMAVGSPRPPDTHRDGDRATTVHGLVEILVGTAAPTALRCLPRWEDIVSAAARPGTGGRRKRVDVGFEIEATRELRERYGDPEEIAHRGSLLLIWQMDPDGDGILAARLSGQDVQKGETAMGRSTAASRSPQRTASSPHAPSSRCAPAAAPNTHADWTSRSSATASPPADCNGSATADPTASPATSSPPTPSTTSSKPPTPTCTSAASDAASTGAARTTSS